MEKKLKICYVLPHFYPHVGGSEQAFLDVISNLILTKNVDVRVITSSSSGISGIHEHNNIKIYSYSWKMFFGHPIVKEKDLFEHIKWADVVHCAVYSPVIPTLKVCKKHQKPVIVTVHEVLRYRWFWIEKNIFKASLFWLYERINVLIKPTFFHTCSEATKKDLLCVNKKANVENIYWISENKEKDLTKLKPNYNTFLKFFDIKKEDKVFLNYGRPGKTKGLFIYLEAIRKLFVANDYNTLSNVKFCFIMADDPMVEKQKFLKLVNKYGLEKNVIVRSSVSREDLKNYIICANYVVVPSITEGFGLTAIEACEMDKKLIHSSGGSLPEVTFGNILQFENRNSDDLFRCLTNVLTKDEDKVFSKKIKKDFSSKKVVNSFYELYQKVIKYNEK